MRKNPKWLKNAVFYEIYPQSFYDTNADGIGDINGIIEKLDYVKELDCNAIWLNPCFESPFRDAGYDVSDYYKIAPRYGTNKDIKRLFKKAGDKGIRICLDFVPGHTSIDHHWFKKSSKPEKNKYSNWYIWTNSWNENVKNLPYSFINGYSDRDGLYMTNFFYSQPALNYGFATPGPKMPWQLSTEHPDVKALRNEMKNILRFWLDMGASGFRVDMAFSLVKNDTQQKTGEFWIDIRRMFDKKYPEAILISEWSNPPHAIPAGFHIDHFLHFGPSTGYNSLFRYEQHRNIKNSDQHKYSFFDKKGKGDITIFLKDYIAFHKNTRKSGYISIVTGNHDMKRLALGRTKEELKVIFAFILTMPGIPFIYYGDEIGMDYIKNLISKEGGYSRTGSRTPMQWNDKPNAGFSTASKEKLYLPVDERKNRASVALQQGNKSSLLETVKALINIRKSSGALSADGDFTSVYAKAKKYPFIYLRSMRKERILVVLNPSNKKEIVNINNLNIDDNYKILSGQGVQLNKANKNIQISVDKISYGIIKI